VGVLVQTNYGGVLQVLGAPVGRELGRYAFQGAVEAERAPQPGAPQPGAPAGAPPAGEAPPERGDGSVVVVVATDAPLADRNLGRLAARAMLGVARTGSSASNGSGDYVVAFSTAPSVRRRSGPPGGAPPAPAAAPSAGLGNDDVSPLFQAVVEATEEAVYNSLFMATTVTGRGRTVEAIPLDRVRAVLARYRAGGR
jgi:D-aminopeptidase